ncbi:SCP2 sterol-binding domain-containing protein [Chengkuizengella axinellae]|uniref:SCP2 sterol-binding domain-containing protein n=1 Tax=Chengkuizengella axinellae TaxID=3064388 RepID=A0ABT9J1P6_9BACL|nr:SCP2 sterol-binding domain-containing protein [Chengkuizengella sp. 2205SS18-9]MDP5275413.1 SCP2 sterol-binding domain-containing protein [Chengkuizengella sp. 2205SS18-9]
MSVKEEFLNLCEKVKANPEHIEGMNCVYQFDVSGEDEGIYVIKLSNGNITYSEGAAENPSCTFQLSSKNLIKLIHGNLNATTAFMMGKLKVKGNLSLAMKLEAVLKKYQ